jgi:hypothetical protein
MRVQLTNNEDIFKWYLATSGYFIVRSMYGDLLNDHTAYLTDLLQRLAFVQLTQGTDEFR